MDILIHTKTIVKNPAILRSYDRILVLSHMRANTSLLGHVLGSHPEINGYYELHIGYYSWRSLIRQKLVFCHEHALKKDSRYFFDKVLHNDHHVNPKLFHGRGSKVIIMIRDPLSTINSIVKLYKKNYPNHKLATINGAASYYSDRLKGLFHLAHLFNGHYFYLDADAITRSPDVTLSSLTQWLELKQPLTKKYQLFKKTGVPKAGDNSDRMMSGVIQQKAASDKKLADIPKNLYSQYQLIADRIIDGSHFSETNNQFF